MSEQIRFQYRKGIVPQGYSFSAKNNVIILSEYVENIANARVREAILYEAERARQLYVEEINNLRSIGEDVNTHDVKRDASMKARFEAQAKFSDVWDEVESTHQTAKLKPPTAAAHGKQTTVPIIYQGKGIKIIITVEAPDKIILDVTEESDTPCRLSDYL